MTKHVFLSVAVSVLALLFLDPFMVFMPMGLSWILLGCLMLATIAYGLLVFTEQVRDEREEMIRGFADRVSCLVGMSLLVVVIGMDLFTEGKVYPEIIIILVLMVISKSVAHYYASKHL
jgi:hypothetical protein